MDNFIDKIVTYIKSLTREDIIILLIVLSPAILTTILMIIGEADQRETQRRLENRPNVTWREIMTPEQRKQMGYDSFDEMEEDFYDIVDYNGGLDGEYSDIDYHDLEDYYGD